MSNESIIFEIRPEHIKLLKNMYVGWCNCEFGAPEIDPKRPYGNSDVIGDIIDILGVKDGNNIRITLSGKEHYVYNYGDISSEIKNMLTQLHHETQTVLQIILNTETFRTGKYKLKDKYSINWEYVGR
jgi:hypothetical protein